jgi:hypothetical protein
MLLQSKLCGPRRQINQHHGYGAESLYMTRWLYFVRYLLGAEPRTGMSCTRPDRGQECNVVYQLKIARRMNDGFRSPSRSSHRSRAPRFPWLQH